MKTNINSIKTSWNIRYSRFVGTLTLYDEKIGIIPRDNLKAEIVGQALLAIDATTGELLMVEIKNALSALGFDPDDYDQKDIIIKVKDYLNAELKETIGYQYATSCNYA